MVMAATVRPPLRQRPRRRRATTGVCALLIPLLGSCSGGATSDAAVVVPDVALGPESNVASSIVPADNGFTFANFTAGQLPELSFDANEVTAMFGDGTEVCATGSTESCVLTAEAASWAQMVNDARNSGHCEGFAVQAMERWDQQAQPPTGQLPFTQDVVEGIMRGFATQFIGEVRDEAAAWRKKSPRDIVAALVDSLADGKPNYVLGVYADVGGHAVLPYKVIFDGNKKATISVLDSNWPGQERFVVVDLERNEWSFSFDGADPLGDSAAWSGGRGRIDLASLDSRLKGSCPFCDDGATARSTILLIRSATPGWSVTVNGATISAADPVAEGVTATPTRAGLIGVEEYVVVLDPGIVDKGATVAVPGTAVVHAVTPAGVVRGDAGGSGARFALTATGVSSGTPGAVVRLAAHDIAGEATGVSSEVKIEQGTMVLRAGASDGRTAEYSVTDGATAARLVAQTGANLPPGTSAVVTVDDDGPGSTVIQTFADGTSNTAASKRNLDLTPPTVAPPAALAGNGSATRLAAPDGGPLELAKGDSGTVDKGNGNAGGDGSSGGTGGGESGGGDARGSGAMTLAMTWNDIGWNAVQLPNDYECGDAKPSLTIHANNHLGRVTIKVLGLPGKSGEGAPAMILDGDMANLVFPVLGITKTFEITVKAGSDVESDGTVVAKTYVNYVRSTCP